MSDQVPTPEPTPRPEQPSMPQTESIPSILQRLHRSGIINLDIPLREALTAIHIEDLEPSLVHDLLIHPQDGPCVSSFLVRHRNNLLLVSGSGGVAARRVQDLR